VFKGHAFTFGMGGCKLCQFSMRCRWWHTCRFRFVLVLLVCLPLLLAFFVLWPFFCLCAYRGLITVVFNFRAMLQHPYFFSLFSFCVWMYTYIYRVDILF
jgi:hypothetical protein